MPLMKSLNTIIVAMLETGREYDDGLSLHFYKHKDGDTQWIYVILLINDCVKKQLE